MSAHSGSDAIRVRGARVHNLRGVDVDIPHQRWVTFTGVSGSGKSSLVFDTVHTEAQRQLVETFSAFARQRLPQLSRPEVDAIDNLTTSIVIDQKPLGRNLRSTVGTATEVHTYLRLLFARCGDTPGIPSFYLGFNNPAGMCPRCEGVGRIIEVDLDLLLDRSRSIRDGAITHPDWKPGSWQWRELVALDTIDVDSPVRDLPAQQVEWLLFSPPVPIERKHGAGTYQKTWRGIASKLAAANADRDNGDGDGRGAAYQRYLVPRTCQDCSGLRLNERALAVRLAGLGLGDVLTLELDQLDAWLAGLEGTLAAPLVHKMRRVLGHLITIGVGYLTLNRPVSTLSGGESQRVKLARQLDCDLTRMTYVLDEPSIGLHPRDTQRLIELLRGLRDRGNTVLVVEHDPDCITAADHVIEIGPGPGRLGGRLVFDGPTEDFPEAGTPIATAMREHHGLPQRTPRPWSEAWEIRDATANNLKNVDVDIPRGIMVAVTGVAGSGKSSLIHDVFLREHPDAIVVDQSPVGRTSRSNPATYIGAFDRIRALFAKATGSPAGRFSFNSKGACPDCSGAGSVAVDMNFLDQVTIPCEACEGRRYTAEVLDLTLRGKSIADVLDFTATEAVEFFAADRPLKRILDVLCQVGLDYLTLGQAQSSLSGGEVQRLKLALELSRTGSTYVLDEPTTGLSMVDTARLVSIIDRLVGNGNSVIVIEHNMQVVAAADWVIDLGPDGGRDGGSIVAAGTIAELLDAPTHTGQALRQLAQFGQPGPEHRPARGGYA
ncbi:MAG: excinuclease ABC subunit UvrA [Dactylosporangium sp.]|nr:excinuclease ABC subunit UvrA [Dactylosporangium sp.]NNJ60299.1 excinuclease ABC subunit UvrA [Dactylosporangium sp.]